MNRHPDNLCNDYLLGGGMNNSIISIVKILRDILLTISSIPLVNFSPL